MTPDPERVLAAAEALLTGAVVAIPTDTVYGLAVDPRQAGATAELFRMKGRTTSTPLPVLIGAPDDASGLAVLGEEADALTAAYWPGPLTLVLRRALGSEVFELGSDRTTIGLRCPAHEVAAALLAITGPLAVTSANRHGGPAALTATDVRAVFGEAVIVLDGGTCDGTPSTVVSLVGSAPRQLREGALAFADIEAVLRGLGRRGRGSAGPAG